MPHAYRPKIKAIRHALDGKRGKQHHCSTLLLPQQEMGKLLGGTILCLCLIGLSKKLSRTQEYKII
jgi:serine/threonine protein phosphatase PrpC